MKLLEPKYIVPIIISVILGAAIFGYNYMDYSYKKQALEQQIRSKEQEKTEEDRQRIAKQQQLEICLDEISSRFNKGIENYANGKTISYEEFKSIADFNQKQRRVFQKI